MRLGFLFLSVILHLPSLVFAEDAWTSHRPLRVAPPASKRSLLDGPMLVVDAAKGDDRNAGTQVAPLRTASASDCPSPIRVLRFRISTRTLSIFG